MIVHETEGMDTVAKAFDPFLNKGVKVNAILIIKENCLAPIAAKDNVIECPRDVDSGLPSHEVVLSNKLQYCKPDPKTFDPKTFFGKHKLKEQNINFKL